MAKRALVLMYPRSDEGQVITPYQVLKRGGVKCILAGPTTEPIMGSWGMRIIPELTLVDAMKQGPYDVVVLCGGRWAWQSLVADKNVAAIMREQEASGRLLAGICTATMVMKEHGIMYGRRLTTYPKVEEVMLQGDHYIFKKDDVVIDGNLITSKGHNTTLIWAMKILEHVTDVDTARRVAQELLLPYY